MRKNGFTLIELLAVIVILAIIALIATPIILGIINDAREKANERSVELYASAVRNGIAAYQLKGTKAPESFDDLTIQYDGNVVCETEELYEDGSFYIADCTVNGDEVDYTYGEQQVTQVYKPQYYHFEVGFSGTIGETAAPANPSSVPPTGEICYLGYDVADGKVSAAYACFTRNETEYCLKPNDFAKSTEIIKDAYSDLLEVPDVCYFNNNRNGCYFSVSAFADSDGSVSAGCGVNFSVSSSGRFVCEF